VTFPLPFPYFELKNKNGGKVTYLNSRQKLKTLFFKLKAQKLNQNQIKTQAFNMIFLFNFLIFSKELLRQAIAHKSDKFQNRPGRCNRPLMLI
jgi:hypothetical protein